MGYSRKKYKPLYDGILRCDDKGVVMFGDSESVFDRKYKDRSAEYGGKLGICIRVNKRQTWYVEDTSESCDKDEVFVGRNNDIIVKMGTKLFEVLFREAQ